MSDAATPRRGTETSAFGAGRRESHDASAFYARFTPPDISTDDTITPLPSSVAPNSIIHGDSRRLTEHLPANSVALVVTSPPYFVGKEYEAAVVGDSDTRTAGIPTSYLDYLEMLEDVFRECVEVLEPGGRIAVNVANLGRKPYRSLSADVIHILQDKLKLLLRGEIIWQKAEGATGSVAWGSYRLATNPVLRDVTERIIVASKGRFDRAKGKGRVSTLSADDFMEATLDRWRIDPESAHRVNHPAPFPIELPRRLIDLYTYEGDVVLDPFAGSGTTVIAAARGRRIGIGVDADADYVERARARVEAELERLRVRPHVPPMTVDGADPLFELPDGDLPVDTDDRAEWFQARATQEGKKASAIARRMLEEAGFEILDEKYKVPDGSGVQFNFHAASHDGARWFVDVSGAFTTVRPGLMRTDTVWKLLGRIHAVKAKDDNRSAVPPILVLTSNLPKKGTEGDKALRAVGPSSVFDAIEMFDPVAFRRLRVYAQGQSVPEPGFWSENDLTRFG